MTEKQGSILQRKILPRFEDARNEEEQRRGDREKEREREREKDGRVTDGEASGPERA